MQSKREMKQNVWHEVQGSTSLISSRAEDGTKRQIVASRLSSRAEDGTVLDNFSFSINQKAEV